MSDSIFEGSEELNLDDADLERIFDQLKRHSNVELDQEAQRAMAALQMIDRIRELESSEETVRTQFETLADDLNNDPSNLPDSIGRFQIKDLVGKGGFGMVFQAVDPVLDRMVALKIPRPEALMTSELRQRFVREGKAAAALAHPNIVPVFESGSANSICFLASELVEGETLESWVTNQQSVPLEKVVTIGKVLSEAIAHAHQRGVIHRDIKPGNILVDNESESEFHRRIKITDFGLAKQLHQDDGQTQTGALIGTPSFMATEQALQKTATTSSDIYSIGAVIYWLLTGAPPFRGENIIETIQAITKDEPIAPRSIKSSIPKDLESICLRCLEKDPQKRYESASDLYSDLERFENGQPVLARAITPTIRLLRWVGRNQLVSSLLVLLLAGVITSTFGLIRARNAEAKAKQSARDAVVAQKEATQAESEAKMEQELATEVADYLVSIFKIPRSNPKKASEVTAQEILTRASKRIQDDLDNQPQVRIRLMGTMGNAFQNMGLYSDSIEIYRDLFVALEDIDDFDLFEKAELQTEFGNVLRSNDQMEEAREQLDSALAIFETDRSNHLVEMANVHNELSLTHLRTNDVQAIKHLQKARDLNFENDPKSKGVWQLDANIASALYSTGKYEDSLAAFMNAIKGGVEILGESHQRIGTLYGNAGFVQRRLGEIRLSIPLSEKSLRIAKENLPANHPRLGEAYFGVASAYQKVGDLEKAVEHGEKGLEILKQSLPADHKTLKIYKSNHVVTLLLKREYESVVEALNELAAVEKSPEKLIDYQVRIARAEFSQGKIKESKKRLEAVLEQDFSELDASIQTNVLVEHAIVMAKTDPDLAEENMDVVLAEVIESESPPEKVAFFMARFWATLGEEEKCLERLAEVVQHKYKSPRILKPEFDPLRDNPRFIAVEKFMLDQVE